MKLLKQNILVLATLLVHNILFAQGYSKMEIDSISNISAPKVISNSTELIPIFLRNAACAQEEKMLRAEALSYKSLSLMHDYLGRYDSATFYIIKSINTYDKGGFEKEAAYLYCERGYRMKLDDLEKAQEEMLKGLNILKKFKDKQGLSGQYNNYGVIKEFKKELDSAQYYYQLSLDYKYDLNDTISIPYSILNIGVLAGMQKEYKRAKDSISKAILIFRTMKNVPTEAESICELADIHYKQGNKAKAISTLLEGITVAQTVNYLRLIKEAHKKLAEINEETGNLKASLFHQKEYNLLHDSIINETRVKEISALETKFEVVKKEERIAKQQLKIEARNNQILWGLIIIGMIGFGVFYYVKRLRFKKKLEKIAHENKMREERDRISRDLHDNIGSQLAFIVSGATIDKENKSEQLAQIGSFAKDTLDQLRTTVWAIKKDKVLIVEFIEKINLFIEKIKPNSLIDFAIHTDLKEEAFLSPTQSVHLFRIIQESISNAIKHSECYTITTKISLKNDQLTLSITDDGKGFDTNDKKQGNGLKFMQERLEELGGNLNITSSENGTQINCEINTASDL